MTFDGIKISDLKRKGLEALTKSPDVERGTVEVPVSDIHVPCSSLAYSTFLIDAQSLSKPER